MIGNDIVDLNLAKIESNWKRKGFLDKIFTETEQKLILQSKNPEITVWNLWTRKESAYKVFNRTSKISVYNPIKFNCIDIYSTESETLGKVIFEDKTYFTKTFLNPNYIISFAFLDGNQKYSSEIIAIEQYKSFLETKKITKDQFGIPYLFNEKKAMISIAHHGSFCSYISTTIP